MQRADCEYENDKTHVRQITLDLKIGLVCSEQRVF